MHWQLGQMPAYEFAEWIALYRLEAEEREAADKKAKKRLPSGIGGLHGNS